MTLSKSFIYEINTWVWLNDLSRRYQRPVQLGDVPEEVLDELARLNVDFIWFMGIWQRSPAARASALNYTHEYRHVLPDLTDDDVIGSAYAIGAYEVDYHLGGREGLAALRRRLADRGLKLILDFVPNHVATDHHWVTQRPDCMIRGSRDILMKHPGLFFETHSPDGKPLVIGHGRDPYFPAWIDTAQLNALSPEYRQVACETLLDIATQCDGVRCDMAMLMMNEIFSKTWGTFLAGTVPQTEFWEEVIPVIKAQYGEFLFIAEVYWDMEYELIRQGFDLTYDKVLYDRILESHAGKVREHLLAALDFQIRQVRFIENHDESRIAATAGIERSRAAATLICTLPGVVLLHDGQLMARKVKLPMQIKRQPNEPLNHALSTFYYRLLAETHASVYRHGTWQMLDLSPLHEGVNTHNNLLAYSWRSGDDLRLVVVNVTPNWSQAVIQPGDWPAMTGGIWSLYDVLRGAYHIYDGDKLVTEGLTVEMEPFQSCIFRFERLDETSHLWGDRARKSGSE